MSGGRTIAVMQPYFFPYAGYISLIKHTDEFILLDPVQFIKSGWINRNRLLRQDGGALWFNVPLVKESHQSKISDVVINNHIPWQDKILAQILPYKKIAPYYSVVKDLLHWTLEVRYDSITSLNKAALLEVCKYLSISNNIKILSEMDVSYDEPKESDEWPLKICEAMGGVEAYWNPPGGKSFYDKSKYWKSGIDLKFMTIDTPVYDQRRPEFTPHLSIIDMLMFNSPEDVNMMLDRYTLD